LTEVVEDHDCYLVRFRDGTSIVADGGHNWFAAEIKNGVRIQHAQNAAVVKTREMVGSSWAIPLPEPLDGPSRSFPIDPYFFGVWLGNGNHTNVEIAVRTEAAKRTLKDVQAVSPHAYIREWNAAGSLTQISVASHNIRAHLRDANQIGNKHFPDDYLLGSHLQRLAFLQALMDTDGYCSGTGSCVFSNTEETIVDGVTDLLSSLGIVSTKSRTTDNRSERKGSTGPAGK
jgi:replicative DNA helicase